jgi:iron complex transport system permease protein
MNLKKQFLKVIFVIIFMMLFILFLAGFGIADISIFEVAKIILKKLGLIRNIEVESTKIMIVTNIRLPRILLSALVGCGLSSVGAVLQGLFRNPMADSGVLGISAGAAFGAALGIIFGFHNISLMAFLGAVLTIAFIYFLGSGKGKDGNLTILLAGLAVSFLLTSLTHLLMVFNRNQVEKIIMWTMGSFNAAEWNQVIIVAPVMFFSIIVLTVFSRDLNGISLGEETGRTIGVNVDMVRNIMIFVSSVVIAASVAVSGIISFVGLIIPHIARIIFGPDHRILLPMSGFLGGVFLMSCDTIARTAFQVTEIPVGIVTSIVGVPFFIYLLTNSKRR